MKHYGCVVCSQWLRWLRGKLISPCTGHRKDCGNNRKPKVSLQSLGLCLCIQCGSRGNLALGNYAEAGRSLEVQRMGSLCVGGVGMWCVLYASVARLFPLNVH